MKNVFDGIRSKVKKAFHQGKGGVEDVKQNISSRKDKFSNDPVNPGLEEKSENVGQKVFEKTGKIREGVGQSSTVKPQEDFTKIQRNIEREKKDQR